MKKIFYSVVLFLLPLLFLDGCSRQEQDSSYQIFYLNTDITKLIPETVEVEEAEGETLVRKLLKQLQTQPDDAGLRQTIPSDVKVESVNLTAYQITVDFSEEYYQMEATEEILARAAIARHCFRFQNIRMWHLQWVKNRWSWKTG